MAGCNGLLGLVLLGQFASFMDTASAFLVKLLVYRQGPRFPILQYVLTYVLICVPAAFGAISSARRTSRACKDFPARCVRRHRTSPTGAGIPTEIMDDHHLPNLPSLYGGFSPGRTGNGVIYTALSPSSAEKGASCGTIRKHSNIETTMLLPDTDDSSENSFVSENTVLPKIELAKGRSGEPANPRTDSPSVSYSCSPTSDCCTPANRTDSTCPTPGPRCNSGSDAETLSGALEMEQPLSTEKKVRNSIKAEALSKSFRVTAATTAAEAGTPACGSPPPSGSQINSDYPEFCVGVPHREIVIMPAELAVEQKMFQQSTSVESMKTSDRLLNRNSRRRGIEPIGPSCYGSKVMRWLKLAGTVLRSTFAVRSTPFYFLLGILDVQGGILSVVAVHHANLATVCLIDWVALLTAFLLSVAMLGERVTRSKVAALVTGLAGSVFILYSDAVSGTDTKDLTMLPHWVQPPAARLAPETLKKDSHYQTQNSGNQVEGLISTAGRRANGMGRVRAADLLSYGSRRVPPASSPPEISDTIRGAAFGINRKVNLSASSVRTKSNPVIEVSTLPSTSTDRSHVPKGQITNIEPFQPERFFGDMMSVLSAIFLGSVTVMMEMALAAGASSNEVLLKAFGAATWGGLFQFLIFEAPRARELLTMDLVCWLYFIGAAVTMAVCYALAPFILDRCTSAFLNLSLLSSAGLAVLLSSFVFGDPFPLPYFVGLLAILGSLMIYHAESDEPAGKGTDEKGGGVYRTNAPSLATGQQNEAPI